MGRLSLPGVSRSRQGGAAIEVGPVADPLLSRYNEGKPVVGSLLLGLYDDSGSLHHVGFTSTIKREMRWRPDKSPRQCTLQQVKQKKANLMKLLK